MATRKTTSATTEVASTYTAEVEAVESAATEHQVIIEKNEQYHFFKITCPEGHYLTTYKDGDDITLYSDSLEVYTPLTADTSKWHCVTDEEHTAYIEAREKAIEEMMEKERAEMMSDTGATSE